MDEKWNEKISRFSPGNTLQGIEGDRAAQHDEFLAKVTTIPEFIEAKEKFPGILSYLDIRHWYSTGGYKESSPRTPQSKLRAAAFVLEANMYVDSLTDGLDGGKLTIDQLRRANADILEIHLIHYPEDYGNREEFEFEEDDAVPHVGDHAGMTQGDYVAAYRAFIKKGDNAAISPLRSILKKSYKEAADSYEKTSAEGIERVRNLQKAVGEYAKLRAVIGDDEGIVKEVRRLGELSSNATRDAIQAERIRAKDRLLKEITAYESAAASAHAPGTRIKAYQHALTDCRDFTGAYGNDPEVEEIHSRFDRLHTQAEVDELRALFPSEDEEPEELKEFVFEADDAVPHVGEYAPLARDDYLAAYTAFRENPVMADIIGKKVASMTHPEPIEEPADDSVVADYLKGATTALPAPADKTITIFTTRPVVSAPAEVASPTPVAEISLIRTEPTLVPKQDETIAPVSAKTRKLSDYFSSLSTRLFEFGSYDVGKLFTRTMQRGVQTVADMTEGLFETSYDFGMSFEKGIRVAGYAALVAATLSNSGDLPRNAQRDLVSSSPLKPKTEQWPVVPFGAAEVKLGPYTGEKAPEKAEHKKIVHKVKKGNTLIRMAEVYLGDGNRWQEIAQLNGIKDPTKLQINQEIEIPNGFDFIDYTIREGQTLSGLAGHYMNGPQDYPELARLNNIPDPDKIYIGQKIRIPIQHEIRKVSEMLFDKSMRNGLGTLGVYPAEKQRISIKLSDYKPENMQTAKNDVKPAAYDTARVTERYNDIISRNPSMGVEDAFRLAAGISKSDYDNARTPSLKMAA